MFEPFANVKESADSSQSMYAPDVAPKNLTSCPVSLTPTVKVFDKVVAPVNVLAFEPVCVREWLNDKAAPLTVNPALKSPLPKATLPRVPLNTSPVFVAFAIKVNLLALSS